jgi:ribosome-associated protein
MIPHILQISRNSFKKVFIDGTINEDMRDYIELNSFIKVLGLAPTGGQAKLLIRSEAVTVNGDVETRNKKKLVLNDIVEVEGKKYTVTEKYLA